MTRRHYTNLAPPTTLASGITDSDLGATLASLSGYPVTYPYTVAIERATDNEELVLVTNSSGVMATITRAYGGTTAKAHSLGTAWEHVVDATDADEANAHVNASAAVHGLSGTVVGTTDSQTVTNKTISSSTNLATSTDVALTTKAAGSGTAAQIKSLDSAGSTTLFQIAQSGAATITSNATAADVLLVKGPASHSGRLLDVQNSAAAHLIAADSSGRITHKPSSMSSVAIKVVPPDSSVHDVLSFRDNTDASDNFLVDTGGRITSAATINLRGWFSDDPIRLPLDGSKFKVDQNGVVTCSNTWTSYTPAWTSTGTAPALGNGTSVGGYIQYGELVSVWGKITFGSTSTFGTGTYRLSLPVTADTAMVAAFGPVYLRDAATADYIGVGVLVTGGTFGVNGLAGSGTNTVWTPTSPVTLANLDSITWSFSYQAA